MQPEQIELWLDMQFSPQIAEYITTAFSIKATSSYTLQFNTEDDDVIFKKAKEAGNVIILTKDKDFVDLAMRFQSPPKIILLRTGNCSNQAMKSLLSEHLSFALEQLLNTSAELVEIKAKNIL